MKKTMKVWVARDESPGLSWYSLYWYKVKPTKDEGCGIWNNETDGVHEFPEDYLPEGLNPQWEDKEPIQLQITIEVV